MAFFELFDGLAPKQLGKRNSDGFGPRRKSARDGGVEFGEQIVGHADGDLTRMHTTKHTRDERMIGCRVTARSSEICPVMTG